MRSVRGRNVNGEAEERYSTASQWTLMRRKLARHTLALCGLAVLGALYFGAIFCDFLSPYGPDEDHPGFIQAPPSRIHFVDPTGAFHLRPFVYSVSQGEVDPQKWTRSFVENRGRQFPVRLFVRGTPYRWLGLLRTDIHLFGVEAPGALFLFGTDEIGRDVFSRILYASRVSLTIGLVGVFLSFLLGCVLGGISGYLGGTVDYAVQRMIELLLSIPDIPLWMALSAALPPRWPPMRTYFGITIILSILGWCRLARVVRGKLLSLKGEDFVIAAKLAGAGSFRIINRHLLPSFLSYLIVDLTLSIPGMILGETALSFLGLGLRPPVVSWGVMLQSAQNIRSVALYPWLLLPVVFVVLTVLAFNFVGDGLRDAADPYKT